MPTFDDVVMQTIDEVVRNVFEDKTAETIFRYSGEAGSENVDDRVRAFAGSLPKILGTGSVIIEDLILETLYSRLGLELQWKKDYGFTDYVIELKNWTERGERGK
jgi:hypothetical protein